MIVELAGRPGGGKNPQKFRIGPDGRSAGSFLPPYDPVTPARHIKSAPAADAQLPATGFLCPLASDICFGKF